MSARRSPSTCQPLALDSGKTLSPFTVAYMTYGALNAAKCNAVLVCHALTGDQFAASDHPVTGKPGWWDDLVGPGKPIDTDRFFVICANVMGGCMGTTGPAEIDPATGEPYGLNFPLVTMRDMVRAQAMLLDALGIDEILCGHRRLDGRHAGAAMGGELIPNACAPCADRQRRAPLGAEHRVPRSRPPGDHGRSRLEGRRLSALRHHARPRALRSRAWPRTSPIFRKRRCSANSAATCRTARRCRSASTPDFQIECYLHHQGTTFVDRFDANSYLYITRAMDYFDLAADYGGQLAEAFRARTTRFCIISFTSDWLFPTAENKRIAHALNAVAANVSFVEIETDSGHDAFLLDEPEMFATVRGFLNAVASTRAWHERRGHLRPDLAAIAAMIPERRARARCRLRRRRAARISGAHKERGWARHRIVAAECECLRGARPVGDAGRCRHRSGGISRAGLRCR